MRAAWPAALLALALPGPASAAQAAEPSGAILFTANKAEGSVSRIRLADGREERRGPACETPHELALSPDGVHLAVGCYDGETIEILRSADLERVTTVPLGAGARPHGVVWHANGELFASAEGRKSVFRVRAPLSAQPQVTEFPTGKDGSHMVVVSADARTAWTADLVSGTVTRIDLTGGAAPLSAATGKGTEGIALSPDGTKLWVSAREANTLMQLDPATLAVRRTAATGSFPLRVAAHPGGRWVAVSNLKDGAVGVHDAETGALVRTIRVSGADASVQVTLLFNADGERLYAAETQLSKVAEIDFATGALLGRLGGGVGGDGLAILPQDGRVAP